jgi:hypothetical protein
MLGFGGKSATAQQGDQTVRPSRASRERDAVRVRFLLVLAALLGCAGQPSGQRISDAAKQYVIAFVDVTLVPMDRERLVPHQTVLVRGTRIAEIGPVPQLHLPSEAQRIDGRGKFLMPGLADMHSHPERLLDLTAYVANGVTTLRTMGSPPDPRQWRAAAAANDLVSPAIYAAGPVLGRLRADLVLLNGNPLADVTNTKRPSA